MSADFFNETNGQDGGGLLVTTLATVLQANVTDLSTYDWFMQKVDQFPIKISFFFSLAMVLGSVVPYLPQYIQIKQSQNTEGFSPYVCLTLLVANILRIDFWFGKQFETALLIQSIVMILAMFLLLELCVRVRNANMIVQNRKRYFADFDIRYFWEWTDFISYVECMTVFSFLTGFIMFLFIEVPWVVEGFGLVALVTESLLASPQFYRNFKSKSTEGMSRLMVFTWFLGDLYKTAYFLVREAPFQFILCGTTQITFDICIFLQILCYKKATYKKLSKSQTRNLEQRAKRQFKLSARNRVDKTLSSIVAVSNQMLDDTMSVPTRTSISKSMSKCELIPFDDLGTTGPNGTPPSPLDVSIIDLEYSPQRGTRVEHEFRPVYNVEEDEDDDEDDHLLTPNAMIN